MKYLDDIKKHFEEKLKKIVEEEFLKDLFEGSGEHDEVEFNIHQQGIDFFVLKCK